MNSSGSVVVASLAAVAALVGGWFALPMLQEPERVVDSRSSLHVERARRLLHQYDPQLSYSAAVREQLHAADVQVDADALEEGPAEAYKALHGELWTSFQPTRWDLDQPRPENPSYGNLAGDVRSGITAANEATDRNHRLLDEALAEVNAALAVSVGDASGRTDLEANQFMAAVLQQKGLDAHTGAALKRAQAARVRNRLLQLAGKADALHVGSTILTDSGVHSRIDALRERIGETENSVAQKRTDRAELERRIQDMETRMAAAEEQAEATRREIDQLMSDGASFADARGADAFRDRMIQLSEQYTASLRRAHMLEQGGYPKAEIDFSGDFLRGRYLEDGRSTDLTVDRGLRHHRLDREVLASKIETEQASLDALSEDLADLERTREEYAAEESEAKARLAALQPQAAEAFAELNRLASEAAAIEEQSLRHFDEAVSLLQQSVRFADQWIADARERTQSLSPEAQERSAFQPRMDDGWLAGQIHAEAAGLRTAKAWVYYDRFRAALSDARALAAVTAHLKLEEADAAAERTKATEAKRNGLEEIRQAVATLEKAHRGLGKHWTAAAQSAGATYLLVLFGESEYLADVIQQYRNVLKGRESEPFLEPFAARLAALERRSGDTP